MRVLLRCVQLCARVLTEDKTTHQPRKLEELDKVYKYIVKIVNLYLKLRVEADKWAAVRRRASEPPDDVLRPTGLIGFDAMGGLSSSDAGYAGRNEEDSDDLVDLLALFAAMWT